MTENHIKRCLKSFSKIKKEALEYINGSSKPIDILESTTLYKSFIEYKYNSYVKRQYKIDVALFVNIVTLVINHMDDTIDFIYDEYDLESFLKDEYDRLQCDNPTKVDIRYVVLSSPNDSLSDVKIISVDINEHIVHNVEETNDVQESDNIIIEDEPEPWDPPEMNFNNPYFTQTWNGNGSLTENYMYNIPMDDDYYNHKRYVKRMIAFAKELPEPSEDGSEYIIRYRNPSVIHVKSFDNLIDSVNKITRRNGGIYGVIITTSIHLFLIGEHHAIYSFNVVISSIRDELIDILVFDGEYDMSIHLSDLMRYAMTIHQNILDEVERLNNEE